MYHRALENTRVFSCARNLDLVAVFAVSALFVFVLSLLCFCVLPFSSVNKDLYKTESVIAKDHELSVGVDSCRLGWVRHLSVGGRTWQDS